MMNRKRSKLIGIKKAVSVPILIIAFGLFIQKTYAGESNLATIKIIKIIKSTNK